MPKKLPWGSIALLLVFAILAIVTIIMLKPWEGRSGGSDQTLQWFRRSTWLTLENTEDNLPIENVLIYAPFPEEFENLHFNGYWFFTDNNGILTTQNGDVIENTLVGRFPPVSTIEETSVGKRVAIRMDNMYPGDDIVVFWTFWALEDTSLYDVPSETRCKAYVDYSPEKPINLLLEFHLRHADNLFYGPSWEWWGTITGPGWVDAPSET